jgi:hypothetical protein
MGSTAFWCKVKDEEDLAKDKEKEEGQLHIYIEIY